MRRQKDRSLTPQLGHQLAEPNPFLGVEPDRWLVDDEYLRLVNERLRDTEPPDHSARQLLDLPMGDLAQPDLV